MTLDELNVGERATVQGLHAPCSELRNKLLSFGVVPGCLLEVQAFAPLGDPMIVKCSNCSLALRKDEARCVSVRLS